MQTREKIRGYLVENFLFGDTSVLTADDISLLDNGIIDSVGVMEIVAFLEQDFGIKVADEDLVPDNLDSVDNLVRFVGVKSGA